MQDHAFEWDAVKAATDLRLHAISFEIAKEVFRDAFEIEWVDDQQGVAEPRYSILGMAGVRLLLHDWTLVDALTDEDVMAAALKDPDAQPITSNRLASMRRVPRTQTMRRALNLTQEQFSARYRIPLEMLRQWEQGQTEPEQMARAYLTVIAGDPENVARALIANQR